MKPDPQELEKLLDGVEGWLPLDDAVYLAGVAFEASAAIIEIGAYRGRSTIALSYGASLAAEPVPVYSIEPHMEFTGAFGGSFGPQDREAFYENLLRSGMARYSALVNLPSEQAAMAWQGGIGLLFIDGDHRYDAVKKDVLAWTGSVVEGGLVVFDDTYIADSGPLRVYEELLATNRYREAQSVGKLRTLCKVDER